MPQFEQIRIHPTNGRAPVKFEGMLMACVDHKRSNSVRWAELKAYKTRAGKWVIEQIGHTKVDGETTFVDVFIYDDDEDMTGHFGFGPLAEKLYTKLGISEITIL